MTATEITITTTANPAAATISRVRRERLRDGPDSSAPLPDFALASDFLKSSINSS